MLGRQAHSCLRVAAEPTQFRQVPTNCLRPRLRQHAAERKHHDADAAWMQCVLWDLARIADRDFFV